MNKKSVLIVVLALILALCPAAWAEDYEAGTMRLLRYEGTVEIFDPAGQPRFVLENARFSSGETMRTGENSLASVSLDDSKILTQDQNTQVQFIQEGSHMLLKLIEGEIFLDVQKKLDTNVCLPLRGDVFRYIKSCKQQFDFIFADPPYALKELPTIPGLIFEKGLLKDDGILVFEHGKDNDFSSDPHFVEHRTYGSVNFSIFRKEATASL